MMYLISCRRKLWRSARLSAADVAFVCRKDEDPAASDEPISREQLIAATAGRTVLLLVHGYNTPAEGLRSAYFDIRDRVRAHVPAFDPVVGYVWPGGRRPAAYTAARRRTGETARRLRVWLEALRQAGATVDVMTHSMGARVALAALAGAPPLLRGLYLLGAAVRDNALEPGHPLHTATAACARLYVIHSRRDTVLQAAFRFAESDKALGWSGPEHPDRLPENVHVIDATEAVPDHGAYRSADAVYRLMAAVAQGRDIPQRSALIDY